jgi:F1F0 ATPase subunit 2
MLVGMAMDARAMMQVFAMEREATALLLGSGAWLTAGGVLGAFHFLSLRRSARMLATSCAPPAALTLHLIRFAVTAGALIVIARHGALPLLTAMLGLVVARTAVLQAVTGAGETPRGGVAAISPPDAAIGLAGMANSCVPRGATGAGARTSPASPSFRDSAPLKTGGTTTPNTGPRSLP